MGKDVSMADYLSDLSAFYEDYELQDGEFTVNTVLQNMKKPVPRGRVLLGLHSRVRSGMLDKKWERIDGRYQWVFWEK